MSPWVIGQKKDAEESVISETKFVRFIGVNELLNAI
jgi:hypothetical protein